ncbi:MAG TPA: choice-of-anchor V domain-containing protein [Bacteroidia bacterium]|jgi:hypothetical protein
MKRNSPYHKTLTRFFFVFALSAIAYANISFDALDNNGKAGYTGSQGESYCTSCHTGTALNGGGGSVTIGGAPSVYALGQTYTITVTVSQSNRSLFGFAMEALTSTNVNAGTLVVTNSAEDHILTAFNGRKNITHQLNGGATVNSHTFTFNWTAPSTNVGVVKFYAVGNAANGNNSDTGDLIYSTNVTINAPSGVEPLGSDELQVSVSPNPVEEKFVVECSLKNKALVTARLFSLDGKLVNVLLNETDDAGLFHKQLNVPSNTSPGIYLLEVNVDGKRSVKKIIIQ